MTKKADRKRCAIYTRKSTEEGLEQEFNTLDAQREACAAYILSQRHEGWSMIETGYDDGGFSGGSTDRPALQRLLEDIRAGLIDVVLVYKVDRLSRSLADFVRLVELFDQHTVSFVSVTQQFNTSTSMGRLTLNVLLSFAQFEREVTSERIRDKIAASKKKGMWMGGVVPLGYDRVEKQLVVNAGEAKVVRDIFERYLTVGSVRTLKHDLDQAGIVSKLREGAVRTGGKPFSRGALYAILKNPIYVGKVSHHDQLYPGKHKAIVAEKIWKAVQERIASNREAKAASAHAQYPSLLRGLVFDDRGNPMSPHYTRRKQKHYAYYVSQAKLQYRDGEAGSVARIASTELDQIVVDRILALLRSPEPLFDGGSSSALNPLDRESVADRGRVLAGQWSELEVRQRAERLKDWVNSVRVSKSIVQLTLNRPALLKMLLADGESSDLISTAEHELLIDISVELRRCGIETRLVIADGPEPTVHTRSVRAVQSALLKAMQWNEQLMTGQASSNIEIAQREGVDDEYVRRIGKLAFLAPDIVEQVMAGNVPAALSLDVLHQGYPDEWALQREQFLGE